MNRKKVFLTGATGVMGSEGLKRLVAHSDQYQIKVLARPGKKNVKKLLPFERQGVDVIWGDLLEVEAVTAGVAWADIVLHVGGMVSPAADWYPEQTIRTNVGAMKNIVSAAERHNPDVKIVYIGSVAQYGNRAVPYHWGAAGDKLEPAYYDAYAYSKVEAERILAESNLKNWVSLRQTGILHWGLLLKATDPISFHVPIEGVLEWATAEDSGRLLEHVCRDDVPEDFWRKFYNIGSGAAYRLTNYEFEQQLLEALGCPAPEKVFNARWFATQNFHGVWYEDSDRLEEILHFRRGDTPAEYFKYMRTRMPEIFKLAPLAPAFVIKAFMGHVAKTPALGPMYWIKTNDRGRIDAAWGGLDKWEALPDWSGFNLNRPDDKNPGEPTPREYTLDSVRKYAEEREGKLIDAPDGEIDADTLLTFVCEHGHEFKLKARTALRGGHWCPVCVKERVRLDELKKTLAKS